jgi:predicted amidohydrolase
MTKIALFQSNTGIDPAANAAALVRAIGEAAKGGATILFTPEMSGLLDRNSERASANLRNEQDDLVLAACRAAAKEHDIWVHVGSLAILAGLPRRRSLGRGQWHAGRKAWPDHLL